MYGLHIPTSWNLSPVTPDLLASFKGDMPLLMWTKLEENVWIGFVLTYRLDLSYSI